MQRGLLGLFRHYLQFVAHHPAWIWVETSGASGGVRMPSLVHLAHWVHGCGW